MEKSLPIGQLLIRKGLISKRQLQNALNRQKNEKNYRKIGDILIEMGALCEKELVRVLSSQLDVPFIDLEEARVPPLIASKLPEDVARSHKAVVWGQKGDDYKVAVVDPTDIYQIDNLSQILHADIEVFITTSKGLEQCLKKLYSQEGEDSSSAIELAEKVIEEAILRGASDVHIQPRAEETRIRFRVDGVLGPGISFPRAIHSSLLSRLKITAGMDIGEKRRPQDGRMQLKKDDVKWDLRLSTISTNFGEKLAIRFLDRFNIPSISRLGFSPQQNRELKELVEGGYGLVLVAGPTGSGKTTTLFALLDGLNKKDLNVITVEDPIEYILPGIDQVQVNRKIELHFSAALRSILRQDPDVIMVGEIRDTETARIAVNAALTGHLVLSSVHTGDAPSAITRLVDMGVEPYLLSSTLRGVLSQRLLRKLCSNCREEQRIDGPWKKLIEKNSKKAYASKGCLRCGGLGYKGRVAIGELLIPDDNLSGLLAKKVTAGEFKKAAQEKMKTSLKEESLLRVAEGITSLEEALRVVSFF